jgi:hypothetical protein
MQAAFFGSFQVLSVLGFCRGKLSRFIRPQDCGFCAFEIIPDGERPKHEQTQTDSYTSHLR